MTEPLFRHLFQVKKRIISAKRLLIVLDYDGTLTPLVENPSQALLSEEMKWVLEKLSHVPSLTMAIISGRSLDDVRNKVGMEGLIFAGNHGLDISGPKIQFIEPTALQESPTFHALAKELSKRLNRIDGAVIEDKTLTISIHYRSVADHMLDSLRQIVNGVVAKIQKPFRLTHGHKVIEIRPTVNWNKGKATQWIQEKLDRPNSLVIAIGDDQTDEDIFWAFPKDITIKVGDPNHTLARYYVDHSQQVYEFLKWLYSVVNSGG